MSSAEAQAGMEQVGEGGRRAKQPRHAQGFIRPNKPCLLLEGDVQNESIKSGNGHNRAPISGSPSHQSRFLVHSFPTQ